MLLPLLVVVGGLRILHGAEPSPVGPPWPRHVIDDSSRGADGVRLGDLNGDGLPDIVTGWEEGGEIRAVLNPGPQHGMERWPGVTVGRVKSPEDAVLVDMNGDGVLDVVSSCEGTEKALYAHVAPSKHDELLEASAWTTDVLSASRGLMQWMYCAPAEVDGHNGVDLIAGGKNENAALGWFEAPADRRDLAAWTWHTIADAGWIMSIIPRDVDGDGDADVIVSDRKGWNRGVHWFENPGSEAASNPWPRHSIGGRDREVMFLAEGDLDGDGQLHLVCAVRGDDLFWLRRRSATESTERTIAMPNGTGTGKGVAVGDLDGDGRRDIVVSCENAKDASGVFWLRQQGADEVQTWIPLQISGMRDGVKFDRVELLDLDGDEDLDVLTCEEADNLGVVWYENSLR